jgi:CDP-3, 6-dideoxy-D-glycero-L-glycero-4-hexulose-4-reductase
MKNILLIGATGFIGKNIILDLVKKYKVYALIRYKKKNLFKKNLIKSIHFIYYKNLKDLEKKIAKKNFYCLINCATFYKKKHTISDINKIINSNVRLPSFLYEWSKKMKIKKFISFGTIWEHHNGILNNPYNFYAATKLAAYFLMKYYSKSNLLTKYYHLLLGDTYGPNDERKKIIPVLIKNYKNNKITTINSKKLNINYLHVKDISYAIERIIKKNIKPGKYLLENSNKIMAKDLIKSVNSKLKKKIKVKWLNNNQNIKILKIKKLPVWRPIHKIEENLLKLLNEKK